jgi:uncharacterized phage protein gp47/JayE
MTLTAPTTKQISDNLIAQMEASLNQTIPLLPKAFNRVLAKALAGVFVLLYKYVGFTALQMFVQTASSKDTEVNGRTVNPLRFWQELSGVEPRGSATNAELSVTVAVTNQTGVLSSGSQLVSAATGVTYITLADVLLNAATVLVSVRAVADQSNNGGRGTIGNLDAGDPLSFANPLPNVARDAVVSSQIITAANEENVEVFRRRILDWFQKRPQGGAYADYEEWAESTDGIISAYPYTGLPGQVNLYSEATVASSGNADGIPTTAQLTAVLASVTVNEAGLASRRNVNTFVNSLPILRTAFAVTVVGVAGVSNLAQVRGDITTAVVDYFRSTAPFIPGLTLPPRNDQITRTRVSAIVEDIVTAANGTFTSSTFELSGDPGALEVYALNEGEKAKASAVSFT